MTHSLRTAPEGGLSKLMQSRQHAWRGLSYAVMTLGALSACLGLWAVWYSLQNELPDTVWVAQYLKDGKLNFNKPQDVRNSWQALPGCVRLADDSVWRLGGASVAGCPGDLAPPKALPPGLTRLQEVLANWRHSGAADNAPAQAQGQSAPQGNSAQLTIEPPVQAAAQAYAECFTGSVAACASLGVDMVNWREHFEGAAARSTGVLVMDVNTGAIEAMASAFSPCYGVDHSGTARAAGCPALPQKPAARPYMTSTRALAEAMFASTDKADLALALLRDPKLGPQLQGPLKERFMQALKTSDSAWFLDHLFCKDTGFGPCQRPAAAQQAALDLGLNIHCDKPSANCGQRNLLGFDKVGSYPVMAGRLFVQPDKPGGHQFVYMPPEVIKAYPLGFAARCSAQKWEKCTQGASFIDVMSEAYGQGHSLASPLGVATMLTQLAGAANTPLGQPAPLVMPHLFAAGYHDIERSRIDPAHAHLILQGMSESLHAGGTAYLACLRASNGKPQACTHHRVAGKTGTPQFRHHNFTLAQRNAFCAKVHAASPDQAHCQMAPYKWYAAAIKRSDAPNAPWDKVVVVLSERNYNQRTGLVDSPMDRGTPNVSAELGLRLIRKLYLEPNQPSAQATKEPA